ncbi:hypothetical protein B296_00020157 [Ensete ventricosum]|uniref:Uncharacterized protein n=1 Tax=Ensete ventricosum TaxID=4639 RepID=A0A426XFU5_ENSVE|nr:hypothetical protein B296_00020157 [Ensete ventricosum]
MLLKVFPDDDLGSTAHDRKEQEKGIYMTLIAMMSSISMLALPERGNVFVLGADTSRVGIGVEIGPPTGYYAYVTYGGGRRGGGKGCSQQACLTPSRWQVGDSTETLVTVFSTTPMPVDVFPNAIAQMKRVQVLKFDLEGALTKGGEVEDLSLADEDRVGKGKGQLSRSFGSGLGTYWW